MHTIYGVTSQKCAQANISQIAENFPQHAIGFEQSK
jgi:hypothetical protein